MRRDEIQERRARLHVEGIDRLELKALANTYLSAHLSDVVTRLVAHYSILVEGEAVVENKGGVVQIEGAGDIPGQAPDAANRATPATPPPSSLGEAVTAYLREFYAEGSPMPGKEELLRQLRVVMRTALQAPAAPGEEGEEGEALAKAVEDEARWLKEHGHPTSIKKGFRFWSSGDRLEKALAAYRQRFPREGE